MRGIRYRFRHEPTSPAPMSRSVRAPRTIQIFAAAIALLCGWLAAPLQPMAQEVQRIAAVVNDDVISLFDIESRITLLIATSGMPNSADVRSRLRQQVLRTLIDERLEVQEATRIKAVATEKEVNDAIGRIETANKMPQGSLLKALAADGIDNASLLAQIKAGLSWQKVVSRRLRPNVDIGQDEIDEVIDRINSEKGTTEYLLAELFLAIEGPDQEDEVRNNMEQMLDQMRRGVSFSAMAQQFSQSASASQGGDIGWVERGSLDPEVVNVIDALEKNHATPPIRTPSGFYVYLLRDKRVLAAADPGESVVSIAQLTLPLDAGAKAVDIEAQKSLAQTVRDSVNGCDDLKRAADELHVSFSDPTPDLHVKDLNPAIRPVVQDLKVGQASEPQQNDSGVTVMMVCARQDPTVALPSREDITENLMRQRLDLIARRYLSDLRRQAFIDVRV
jgi:peptidyl-prolyl cis-trans isomerase SurA